MAAPSETTSTSSSKTGGAVEHTPGPWRAVVRRNQAGLRLVAVDMPPHTSWRPFKAPRRTAYQDYEEANARLIAAAPEQNAELRELAGEFQSFLESGTTPDQMWLEDTLASILKMLAKAREGAS